MTGCDQTSVAHSGRVEDHEIASGDQPRQLRETGVSQARAVALKYQESASTPVRQRFLGDELGREYVIEVGGAEAFRRQRWWLGQLAA
jgi:hypothetical protein